MTNLGELFKFSPVCRGNMSLFSVTMLANSIERKDLVGDGYA